jgi:hypothetical protein
MSHYAKFTISHEKGRLYIIRKFFLRTESQNTQKKDKDKKIAEQGKQNIKINVYFNDV